MSLNSSIRTNVAAKPAMTYKTVNATLVLFVAISVSLPELVLAL